MKGFILGMLAETSIHPGMGQVQSAIDLPVAREATTQYPTIFGSSLKGALREKVERKKPIKDENGKEIETNKKFVEGIFGSEGGSGGVGVADARLLLLHIRSLTGTYRWVTCPYILERLERDWKMIQKSCPKILVRDKVSKDQVLVSKGEGKIFLEEFSFTPIKDEETIEQIAKIIEPLIHHESLRKRLKDQLAVISDKEFANFARYSLPVHTRNLLDEKKISRNLWTEETLPPDTVMYSMVLERPGQSKPWEQLKELLQEEPYLQAGGNETVGQGWFITTVVE